MTPPPPGSRIEVVESGDRLVLRVPAGSPHGRALLFFALFWNAIAWPLAGAFWAVAVAEGVDWGLMPGRQNGGPMPWWGLLFTAVFPAVGIGLGGWWLKMRFTETLILAEPGTAAVRTIWFGRERTRTIPLAPGDRAELEVAWEENDEARYRVRVGPADRKDLKAKERKARSIAFGASFGEEETRWVAAAINRTLGVADPEEPGIDDPNAPPRTVPVAAAAEVAHPLVRTGTDARLRPVIEVKIWPGWPPGKRALVAFGIVFAVVWWTIIAHQVGGDLADLLRGGNGFDLFSLLFNLPFVLAGLAMVSGLIAVCRATVRTTVGEAFLSIRWGTGLLRYTRNVPRDEVREVVVWENFGRVTDSRGTRPIPIAAVRVDPSKSPAVSRDGLLPLTLGGDRDLAEAVAALVRARLEAAGWRQPP